VNRGVRNIAASAAYWVVALMLAFLALGAPCGFAPGTECDADGPNLLGFVLGAVGPIGVLLIAAIIYVAAIWFNRRQRKPR